MNRSALCAPLMLSLICVLGAPPPKPKTPVDEDTEEELDDRESDKVSYNVIEHLISVTDNNIL